jgi:hypothetical protein
MDFCTDVTPLSQPEARTPYDHMQESTMTIRLLSRMTDEVKGSRALSAIFLLLKMTSLHARNSLDQVVDAREPARESMFYLRHLCMAANVQRD